MTNNFSMGYQYDRCVSRGICSINPTTASLLEIILLYIKYTVFYELQLEKYGLKNRRIQTLILNVIALLSSNYEISEVNFQNVSSAFIFELSKLINEYEKLCQEKGIEPIKHDLGILMQTDTKISEYIKLGEKEFNKKIQEYSQEERNLYRCLFVIIKSLSINILILESFGIESDNEVAFVLKIINLFNSSEKDFKSIKEIIINAAEEDCILMKKIRDEQEKIYGKQSHQDVSFSTTKGKALLVVGSNLKELEQILDKLKDKDIDVYTHDNMITAHTFPKFREYTYLKGQFGKGMENCLLDFSTFPGPIILTKYSLFNVENLYRGRLFTTDFAYSKGVIQIKNDDFSEVIDSVKNSKGFKTGKKCKVETVGVFYNDAIKLISAKLSNDRIKNLIIIGSQGYSFEEEEYFKSFTKNIPMDTLIIALSGCEKKENLICLNMRADIYGILRLSENIIKNTNKKVSFILPYCDRHALSVILYLQSIKDGNFYIGKWNQTILIPNLLNCLKTEFRIKELTTPKNDLSEMAKK